MATYKVVYASAQPDSKGVVFADLVRNDQGYPSEVFFRQVLKSDPTWQGKTISSVERIA